MVEEDNERLIIGREFQILLSGRNVASTRVNDFAFAVYSEGHG